VIYFWVEAPWLTLITLHSGIKQCVIAYDFPGTSTVVIGDTAAKYDILARECPEAT
jgi:hypothetical protein